jgi:hypothetical protein
MNDAAAAFKDIVLAIASSGILVKIILDWIALKREKAVNKASSQINISMDKSGNGNGSGNGKGQYATLKDLMEHAVECPKEIHKKIEEYNRKVAEKMEENHRETMSTFTDIKVSIAQLKTRKYK